MGPLTVQQKQVGKALTPSCYLKINSLLDPLSFSRQQTSRPSRLNLYGSRENFSRLRSCRNQLTENNSDMASRRNVRYSSLPGDDQYDDAAGDLRFAYSPSSLDRVPWKSVILALFLLSLGSLLLFLSHFIFTGHMGGDRSQALGFLLLGILTFLPGTNQKCLRPFCAGFSKSNGDSVIKFTILMNFRCDLAGDSREVRFICNLTFCKIETSFHEAKLGDLEF